MNDQLEAVYRREVGRCTATLIRILGDVELAEDAVAEAFATAAERWPVSGIPPNPGGWITTTAHRRAIDRLRRESTRTAPHLAAYALHGTDVLPDVAWEPDHLDAFVDVVPDDQLRLMFLCCHPALSADARVALTPRLLSRLRTSEIARAFLVTEPAVAQRIVRAKRKLRDNHAPYRIPDAVELPSRLPSVLATIYLIFTEGHTASSGDQLLRAELTHEAIRLTRVLVELLPDEPEAFGLLALLLLTDARRPARLDEGEDLVSLAEQDRSLWDRNQIAEGHGLVRDCLRGNRPGPYQLQAAIAAVHADAGRYEDTDWAQIVALYDQLLTLRPSPVVALNRAVAIGELHGRSRASTSWALLTSETKTCSRRTSPTTPAAQTCWPEPTASTTRSPTTTVQSRSPPIRWRTASSGNGVRPRLAEHQRFSSADGRPVTRSAESPGHDEAPGVNRAGQGASGRAGVSEALARFQVRLTHAMALVGTRFPRRQPSRAARHLCTDSRGGPWVSPVHPHQGQHLDRTVDPATGATFHRRGGVTFRPLLTHAAAHDMP